jgi:hypothetical protein
MLSLTATSSVEHTLLTIDALDDGDSDSDNDNDNNDDDNDNNREFLNALQAASSDEDD